MFDARRSLRIFFLAFDGGEISYKNAPEMHAKVLGLFGTTSLLVHNLLFVLICVGWLLPSSLLHGAGTLPVPSKVTVGFDGAPNLRYRIMDV